MAKTIGLSAQAVQAIQAERQYAQLYNPALAGSVVLLREIAKDLDDHIGYVEASFCKEVLSKEEDPELFYNVRIETVLTPRLDLLRKACLQADQLGYLTGRYLFEKYRKKVSDLDRATAPE
jgi:hypothetical protein